jgi:hypothetical protein
LICFYRVASAAAAKVPDTIEAKPGNNFLDLVVRLKHFHCALRGGLIPLASY